jgi:simple sugar transport system permease protein
MSTARRPLPAWADIVLLPLINIALAFVVVGIIVARVTYKRRLHP